MCFATQPAVQPGSFALYFHRPPQAGRINRLLCPASCKRPLRTLVLILTALRGEGECFQLPAQADLHLGAAGALVKVDAADGEVPQHTLHDPHTALRQRLHPGGLQHLAAVVQQPQPLHLQVGQIGGGQPVGAEEAEYMGDRLHPVVVLRTVAFHLYTAAFGTMPGIAQKSIHLGFLLVIFYINAMVDSEKRWEQIFLGIMALFALGGCAYITILDENLQLRAGIVYASDILFAILLIIAIFEACRRKMGNPLVIITLVFVAYAFLGKYIPGFLNQPGMTLKKFTSLVYLTTDGIFGSPLYASASYVVLFVLLGAIMSVSGIGDYMTNLATSLFGHMRGGPAKVAVVASGFFGSISGSPTANVIGTGTFTIPMMKKNGFEPEFAAAVEATASTGGAIMPPIMGSTAFIMAEMLGIPYTAVAKAALIPAILYFLAVLFGVDIYAAKHGLKGIPRSQLPKVRSMLKQIYMLAPLIFLIFCMAVFNMTIVRSGLLTIIVTLVLVEINPKTRMTKEQWLQIPVQTVKSAVSVGIACAMAGIISGVIMGSGLGYRISSILTSVAGTSMLLLLVLTMVVSLIMGMGVPTTAAYLVLASLVAPTMIQLGIPPLAAHMFIFYFGCISSITPPVALAAYAGAGLAGCDPNKTGYKAFRLAFCSFLMPYLFVYNPVLLMEGGVLDILWSLVTALIGAYLLASGFEGFFFRWSLKWFERPLMILGAVMLIVPGMVTDLVGIAIIVVEFVTEFMFKRSEKFVPVTVSQSTT